ncbi:MAG: transposase [Moritella sp.]|jgi:transposase
MIAQALRIHESTITRHINYFLIEQKLTSNNGGSDSHLNAEKTKLLISHLTANTYFHTYQICQYIKDTWAICYSVSGMNKWLHQHDFSYK